MKRVSIAALTLVALLRTSVPQRSVLIRDGFFKAQSYFDMDSDEQRLYVNTTEDVLDEAPAAFLFLRGSPTLDVCHCKRPLVRSWSRRGKRRKWGAGMTITLKPEQERIIQSEIQSGHFRSPDEVLDHALAALQEKEHKRKAATPRKNLAQFLMESPLAGAELNLARQKDCARPIEL